MKKKHDELIMKIMELSIDAIFIEDTAGDILMCNKAATEMFGYTKEELIGLNIKELFPDSQAKYLKEVYTKDDLCENEYVERINIKKDKTLFYTEINKKMIELDGQEYMIAFVRDMTESRKLREKLNYLANYDDLTKLRNRREIFRYVHHKKPPFALAIIDVDDFKIINDTYGHYVGDMFLMEIGNLLKEHPDITAGRIGGEEFLVAIHTKSIRYAYMLMRNILNRAHNKLIEYGGIHFSTGMVLHKGNSIDYDINLADELCYKVKRGSKDCIAIE